MRPGARFRRVLVSVLVFVETISELFDVLIVLELLCLVVLLVLVVFLRSSAQLLGDKVEHCNDTHTCSCEWEGVRPDVVKEGWDVSVVSLPIAVGIELLCWVPLEVVLPVLACCADAVHECVDSGIWDAVIVVIGVQ